MALFPKADPLKPLQSKLAVAVDKQHNHERKLGLAEVKDRTGASSDGAADNGHALGGQLGACLCLKSRPQPVGLGQTRL